MKLNAYIGGKPISTEKRLEIYNPATEKLLGTVSFCSKKNIDDAFVEASKAFLIYSKTTCDARIDVLNIMMKVLGDHDEELATILAKEVSKAYKDALVEVRRSVDYIKKTIVEYKKIVANPRSYTAEELENSSLSASYLIEPLGVVLAITPFNYPINLLVAKLAPSLIVGNTVVIKSPTSGSLVTSKFIEYMHKAGIPKGILNLITGSGSEIGDYIIQDKHISLVSFTGSTRIAKKIAAHHVFVPLILENGGKDPAIVYDDVDIKKVAKDVAEGAFAFSGQRCTAIKRVIVHKNIAKEFIDELNHIVNDFIVGEPFMKDVFITPLINKTSLKYNLSILEDAQIKKAKLHQPIKHEGNLLWPVVVSNIKQDMKIWTEEPFGPILPVITFATDEQAIKLANDSVYGLQASIFTKNIAKANLLARSIEAGTVNINKSSSRGPDILPFFGIKDSGFGLQGIRDSIISSSRLKGVVLKK